MMNLSHTDFVSACQNRWILFTCVGTDITKYEVYEHVANLGIKVLVVDVENCALAAKLAENKIAHYLPIDLTSRLTLVDECINAIDNFMVSQNGRLSGATTFWDDSVCLSARIAQHYRLPGNIPRATDLAHDKSASRKFLTNIGYPGPKSIVVATKEEVEAAAKILNFPAIMKPLYGAASIGVRKIESASTAQEDYAIIQDTLDGIYADGELMGLTFEDAGEDVGRSETALRSLVFEEFIQGPEFDCDVVLLDGEVVYCNIMDDWEFEQPHFIEIGSSCPSTRSDEIQKEVREFGVNVLKDMGFTTGVFHVEIIHSSRIGPCLIEVNPRMGGGPVRSIHNSVYGVDLANFVICAALNLHMIPKIIINDKSAVTINLFAKTSGVLTSSIRECQQFLESRTDIVSKYAVGEKGDRVTGWYDGYPSALGRVNFMIDKDVHSAVSLAKSVINEFYSIVEKNTLAEAQ